MRARILQDIVTLVTTSGSVPNVNDEPAVAVFVGNVSKGLVPVVYDLIKNDPQSAMLGPISADDIELAYKAHLAQQPGDKEKMSLPLGDVLNFLRSVNWTQVIATVMSLIGALKPAAAPALK